MENFSRCFEHDIIKQNTSRIPEMDRRLTDIHEALIGTMDRPGWMTRVAAIEKTVGMLCRIGLGALSFFLMGVFGYIGLLIIGK